MSMLRCLYGRVKFVKCALGEPGTSSVYLKVSDPQSACQFIINLHARHLHGMTFTGKKLSKSRTTSVEVNGGKSEGSLIRNGFIVDAALRNTSISEGYYRNEWGRPGNQSSSQTNGEKGNRENTSKCEFNFNSINVRLLETFGIIGTAVAVGINVNSRINEWMPYQNRRGIHDFCQYHHHYLKNSSPLGPPVPCNGASSPSSSSLSRVLDCFTKSSSSPTCGENDPCLTTIRYCGSCLICRGLFDKLLHLYVFPSQTSSSTSIASSILSILPSNSSASLPKVGYNQTEASQEDETDEDYVDEVDGPLPIDQPGLLYLDSASSNDSSCQKSPSPEEDQQQPARDGGDSSRSRQRKKSIYLISEEESEQLKSLAEKSISQPSKSEYISLTGSSRVSSSPESSTDSAKCSSNLEHDSTSSTTPPATGTTASIDAPNAATEDANDIAAVFRMASIEYADQLNNLVAISLMNGHKPDEAMQCWSSCEASSRAFFNMGVAYESGRHAKKARPDLDRAHDCYALAASMGHRDAIYNLALFYLYGKGKIEVNLDRGIELLETAAAKGVEAAHNFIAEVNRNQLLDEIRESLQRKPSSVDMIKRRPLRTSIRPSASMFGTTSTRLKPKHSTAAREGAAGSTSGSTLKRNNSAPDLFALSNASSPLAIPSQ